MNAMQSGINDFVVKIATVNGTGSASANGLLMKALFRMGVPVTGRTCSRPTSRACRPGTRCAPTTTATCRAPAAST